MPETTDADLERAIDALRPAIANMSDADAKAAIVALVMPWAGSQAAACDWFSGVVLPGVGSTPEALIQASNAGLVLDYISHIARGGYA